jgi:hypothetical protein
MFASGRNTSSVPNTGSSISTGVGLRDVSLILSASSAALLAALKAKKSDRIVADS